MTDFSKVAAKAAFGHFSTAASTRSSSSSNSQSLSSSKDKINWSPILVSLLHTTGKVAFSSAHMHEVCRAKLLGKGHNHHRCQPDWFTGIQFSLVFTRQAGTTP